VAQLAARPACIRGIEVPPRTVKIEDEKNVDQLIAAARKILETGH
jgi:hypothetical protein